MKVAACAGVAIDLNWFCLVQRLLWHTQHICEHFPRIENVKPNDADILRNNRMCSQLNVMESEWVVCSSQFLMKFLLG